MQDFQCEDCNHVTEILLDNNNLEETHKCEVCKSNKLKPVLGVSSTDGKHSSWARWKL